MQPNIKKRWKIFVYFTMAFLPIIIIIATSVGAYTTSFTDLWQLMRGHTTEQISYIFWQLRLPRVFLAVLVGSGLSIAGASLQGIFRNPLVDTGLIGVAPGAALMASMYIALSHKIPFIASNEALRWISLPVVSFFGGGLATLCVVKIATKNHYANISIMLLAGIAINAICFTIIGFLIYFTDDAALRDITFWSLGSLATANWPIVGIMSTTLIISSRIIIKNAHRVNQLLLGEQAAKHLGIDPERCKKEIIFAATLITATSVAFCGIIGFLGLIVPHIIRILTSSDHRFVFSGSALLGAILLPTADAFGRTLISPAELPIGIVTSAIGAPFFLWLLLKQRQRVT